MKQYLEYLGPGEVSIIKVGSFTTGTVHEVDEAVARTFEDEAVILAERGEASLWRVHDTDPRVAQEAGTPARRVRTPAAAADEKASPIEASEAGKDGEA